MNGKPQDDKQGTGDHAHQSDLRDKMQVCVVKAFGFELEGPSGAAILWVVRFLSMTLAIKVLS